MQHLQSHLYRCGCARPTAFSRVRECAAFYRSFLLCFGRKPWRPNRRYGNLRWIRIESIRWATFRSDLKMDLHDLADFLHNAARSVGAEITSPWLYLQLGLILTCAGIAFGTGAAVRSRIEM